MEQTPAGTLAPHTPGAKPPRPRATPNDQRAWVMRAAGDVIGPERLARALRMSSRSIYLMMAGRRPVKDGVLIDTRNLLVMQRQVIGAIGNVIREELRDEDR